MARTEAADAPIAIPKRDDSSELRVLGHATRAMCEKRF
jgi:hypothetical protein